MNRPNFPGVSDDLPEIDSRLPYLTTNSEGTLELGHAEEAKGSLADPDLRLLFDEAKVNTNKLLSAGISSNVDPFLLGAIERYQDAIAFDGNNEATEIRVGLAISSINNYAKPLLREEYLSPSVEANLRQIVEINSYAENRLPNWQRFKNHGESFEISDHDAKLTLDLYHSVTKTLEEAADLISEDVIVELNHLQPLVENNLEMEKELSFARVATVNNLVVSLLREIRSERQKPGLWISKMIVSRILQAIETMPILNIGKNVFGWIHTTASTIAKLLGR